MAGRDDIRSAAFSLFAEHGVNGTSLAEIASAAGVREQDVLEHFESPTDILLANDSFQKLLDRFVAEDPQLTPCGAWIVALEECAHAMSTTAWLNDRLRQHLIATDAVVGPHAISLAMQLVADTRTAVAQRTGLSADSAQVGAFAGALLGSLSAMPSANYADPDSWVEANAAAIETLGASLDRLLQ